jgi:hypothetical protein
MLKSALIILGILAILYVAHLALRSYTSSIVPWEAFQAVAKQPNVPVAAPVVYNPPPPPPREVSPAGPNPPNAQGPSLSNPPETAQANDPLAEVNSPTPIRDNMRHPENSFGPGVENSGTRLSIDSGVASNTVAGGVSNFSPEFAQNGGEFMSGIVAHDMFSTDSYATI